MGPPKHPKPGDVVRYCAYVRLGGTHIFHVAIVVGVAPNNPLQVELAVLEPQMTAHDTWKHRSGTRLGAYTLEGFIAEHSDTPKPQHWSWPEA